MTLNNGEAVHKDIVALSREMANYSDRLASSIGCPEGDIWALFLAATGRMVYPEQGTVGLPIPDGPGRGLAHTRYEMWKAALGETLDILGATETRLRLGEDESVVRRHVEEFFADLEK